LSNEANTSSASFEGVDVGAEDVGVTEGISVAASGVSVDVLVDTLGAVAAPVAVTVGSVVGAGTHPPSVAEPANTTSISILTRRILSITPDLLAHWKRTRHGPGADTHMPPNTVGV
jgi:hypothetical protein